MKTKKKAPARPKARRRPEAADSPRNLRTFYRLRRNIYEIVKDAPDHICLTVFSNLLATWCITSGIPIEASLFGFAQTYGKVKREIAELEPITENPISELIQ